MKTLRQRLMWRILGVELVVLFNVLVLVLPLVRRALTSQFDETLQTEYLAISTAIEEENGKVVVDGSDSLPRSRGPIQTRLIFQVWDSAGKELARSEGLDYDLPRPLADNGLIPQFANLVQDHKVALRLASGRVQAISSVRAAAGLSPLEAWLVVAADRSKMDGIFVGVTWVLIGSMVTLLGVTAAMFTWVLRRELAPLDALAARVQQIGISSLNERLPVDALPGELIPVANRLNELLARLETAFSRERQFSDDLAHELRTPISELRTLAEVALKWPETRDSESDQEILAVAIQMETLVNRLLTMARQGDGAETQSRQPVSVAAFVESIWQPLSRHIEGRGLHSEFQVDPELIIGSDPVLLRAIVRNVLENAVEYSLDGGAICVAAEANGDRFSISVTNPTRDLEAGDIPHLFERFWRKDSSRSGNQHSGLGLPVSRAFAERLGCTLSAHFDPGGFLTLTLSGPVHAEPKTSMSPNNLMKNNSKVVASIVSAVILSACMIGSPGCQSDSSKAIAAEATVTRDQAQTVALTKVPGGTVKEAELEKENGRLVWSFDIAVSGQKDITEVQVDARSGEVVSVEKENEADQAKEKIRDRK